MSEGLGEELAEGCLWGLFDALWSVLPWQVNVAILVLIVVIWLVAGHPGL